MDLYVLIKNGEPRVLFVDGFEVGRSSVPLCDIKYKPEKNKKTNIESYCLL